MIAARQPNAMPERVRGASEGPLTLPLQTQWTPTLSPLTQGEGEGRMTFPLTRFSGERVGARAGGVGG
jgi:hypothetical protein